jgi:hypothetical protein
MASVQFQELLFSQECHFLFPLQVPMDQPLNALAMITAFTRGHHLASMNHLVAPLSEDVSMNDSNVVDDKVKELQDKLLQSLASYGLAETSTFGIGHGSEGHMGASEHHQIKANSIVFSSVTP